MNNFFDVAVPYVGIEINFSPVYHFFRDILVVFILWQIGYRGFQAALTIMLISGFFEAGNGICFLKDGTHFHFDFLDLIPSVFAGFLVVSLMSNNFNLTLLLNLLLLFFSVVVILTLLNIALGRKITFKY